MKYERRFTSKITNWCAQPESIVRDLKRTVVADSDRITEACHGHNINHLELIEYIPDQTFFIWKADLADGTQQIEMWVTGTEEVPLLIRSLGFIWKDVEYHQRLSQLIKHQWALNDVLVTEHAATTVLDFLNEISLKCRYADISAIERHQINCDVRQIPLDSLNP